MTDTTVSAEGTYERLLKAMPEIASAVNQFKSEGTQGQAFHALLTALTMPNQAPAPAVIQGQPPLTLVAAVPVRDEDCGDNAAVVSRPSAEVPQQAKGARSRRAGAKKPVARTKGINFYPDGKPSLRDLAAEKKPKNNYEKNLIAVYYLEHVLEMSEVSLGDVLAAYADADWTPPSIPDNALAKTASTRDWLDTSNLTAIHITHKGLRAVEHEMPSAKAGKSA